MNSPQPVVFLQIQVPGGPEGQTLDPKDGKRHRWHEAVSAELVVGWSRKGRRPPVLLPRNHQQTHRYKLRASALEEGMGLEGWMVVTTYQWGMLAGLEKLSLPDRLSDGVGETQSGKVVRWLSRRWFLWRWKIWEGCWSTPWEGQVEMPQGALAREEWGRPPQVWVYHRC